jgi:hypothetical protein
MNPTSEDLADQALQEFHDFVDTESMIVKKEHELSTHFEKWEKALDHIKSLIPKYEPEVEMLNVNIRTKIDEIRELIDERKDIGIRVAKEEIGLLHAINEDIKNKEWRAVKVDSRHAEKGEEGVLRLQLYELEQLHKLFSALIELLNQSIAKSTEESEYKEKEREYYKKFHTVITAYEAIFQDLYEKEKMLNTELKETEQDMEDKKDFSSED